MAIPPELLARLRCPETGQNLSLAESKTLARISNQTGEPLEGALIREDGRRAYPVQKGLPILLLDKGIDLSVK